MVIGGMSEMQNQVVLITGATGGLGSAVSAAFLRAGARVAGVSRSGGTSSGENHFHMEADLSTLDAARSAVATVAAKWGRVDALVHLVGGFAGGTTVADTDDATFDRMFDMNLRSAFHIVRAVLPGMRAQGSGCIVAIGSRAALEPSKGAAAYSASKAALVSLVRTIALENTDRNITANVVLPGTMDTPQNRTAMPNADFTKWVPTEQVAKLLVYLISDEASAVSGAVIPIYGGGL